MRAATDVQRTIGSRIREARQSFPEMSIVRASAFLDVSPVEFERFENGQARPTPEQVILLADLMNLEPSWFFRGLG